MAQTHIRTPQGVKAENLAVAVLAAGNTELLEISTDGLERLAVELLPTVQAFDAFSMEAKVHPDSAYSVITSAITSTPGGVVLAASGTLATLAAGATGWALLDVRPFHSVRFLASANVAGTSTTTARATGYK